MLSWFKRYRRQQLLARPFSADWEAILSRNVAHFGRLNSDERSRLRDITQILIAEKNWEGCGGLQITEEIQVTIAAQAALILLGMTHDYFANVLSILVYPAAFELSQKDELGIGERGQAAAGLAVYRGPAVLTWDAVLSEGRSPSAGRNVVIHEFAHHLDFVDGYFNGTPELRDEEQTNRWRDVMTAEYTGLQRDFHDGRETFLAEQAGWNEGEFFAVASERFFTQPARLRHFHPDLYKVLAVFYLLEPIKWFPEESSACQLDMRIKKSMSFVRHQPNTAPPN